MPSYTSRGLPVAKIYENVIEYMALVGGLLIFLMAVITSVDIAGREIVSKSIPGCYELVGYLLVFVVFFAIAYLEAKRGNVRVEILLSRFPTRVQAAIGLLSAILALFMFGLIVYSSGIWSWDSWVMRETMYGIKGGPLWLWKFGVPFGSFFMCIELIRGIQREIKQLIARSI